MGGVISKSKEIIHPLYDSNCLSGCLYRDDWNWSSPQKVVHLLVWEINPIRNMKGGLKWLRKDTNPKKS